MVKGTIHNPPITSDCKRVVLRHRPKSNTANR